jgi:hypothetical protein
MRLCGLLALFASLADTAAGQELKKVNEPQLNERVEIQFSEGFAKHPTLRFFGPNADSMASIQPEGLRFNVPAGRKDTGNLGVESRLRLRGDFEVTLEYELLALPDPVPNLGAGVGLGILLDTPDEFKARLGRSRRPTGAVFAPSYVTLGQDGKELPKYLFTPPANDKETKGRLRLVRAGTVLFFQAEEGGEGFRTIGTTQIGRADVIAVQAHCNTGWTAVALEARFPRLELRASEFPKMVAPPQPKQRPQPKQPDLPAEGFYQDFRMKQDLLPPLTFFGPDPAEVTRFEKEGLRITFPPKRKIPERVGVQMTERIKGNFEITASYEILKGGQPTDGTGVGVELCVATDSPTKVELAVFRMARINDGEVHTTSRTSTEKGVPRYNVRNFPSECKFGRLKITRVGDEATLWVAEGDAKDFQELDRHALGPEDVTLVRLNAYPGHRQNELDVRFKDLRVRGLLPNEAAAVPSSPVPLDSPKREAGKGLLAVTLAVGMAIPLLAAIALAVVLYWRRRKAQQALR